MKTITKETVLAKIIKGGFNEKEANEMVESNFDRAIEMGFKNLNQIVKYVTC